MSATREELEAALRELIALEPDFEESRGLADRRGAEVEHALTVGAWRAAEVARKALGLPYTWSRHRGPSS